MPSSPAPTRSPRRPRRVRRASAVALATTAAVLAGVPGPASAAAGQPPHPLSLQRSSSTVAPSTGMSQLAAAAVADGGAVRTAGTLPDSVDLTGFAVWPGDQGWHGACASWTTAYTMAGWEANFTHHAGAPFAAMSVYNQVNGGDDRSGTYFADNFAVLETRGVVEATSWTHPFADYTSKPTAAERADAALHRLTPHSTLFVSYSGIGPAARTAIETAVADNRPVGIAMPVFQPFFDLTPADSTFTLADATGPVVGWHAVTVLGYSPDGVTIENSWGAGWGDHGFATLGWDFVQRYVAEAYAGGDFAANGLTPSVARLSRTTVATAGGGTLDVTASRLYSVDATSPSAVSFVSVADPSVSVPADVVAESDTALRVDVPALPGDGEYRVVVTGYNGASVPNGTADVATAVSPGTVAVAPGAHARSNTASWVTVAGLDFGTTSSAFLARGVTATVRGVPASVRWVDDNRIQVLAPAAPAGTTGPVVVSRNGSASPPATLTWVPPTPAVTAVRPDRVADAGRTPVTVTVADASALGSSPTVTLVATSDRTWTVPATVTSVRGAALTFTAPARAAGAPRDYDVVVTGGGGTGTPVTADRFGYRTPLSARAGSTVVSAAGGTVRLSGTGFGTTSAAFAANRITALVNGHGAAVRWGGDRSLSVSVPAGRPGRAGSIVLLHDSVRGPAITAPRYAAVVSRNSASRGRTAGWTTSLRGDGFTGSGGWVLVDSAGRRVAALPVVRSRTALRSARHGAVLIGGSTVATVKLPAMRRGTYRIGFTPSQRVYPGARYAFTAVSAVTFR